MEKKMSWKAFSKKLFDPILTDADPGYYVLYGADIPTDQKKRFMVAWSTFYNIGLAAKGSQFNDKKFWVYLNSVYDTATRASERRHFRGKAGRAALTQWEQKFKQPEKLVDHMFGKDYFIVRENAREVKQMGEYFVWKFADVQERVFGIPCDFTDAASYSPKVPRQGAEIIAPGIDIEKTYEMIAEYMNDLGMVAPPRNDRPMNMQEAETVCCVYKQYLNNKWVHGSRTAKATRSLLALRSDTGDHMLHVLHHKIGTKFKDMGSWAEEKLDQLGH